MAVERGVKSSLKQAHKPCHVSDRFSDLLLRFSNRFSCHFFFIGGGGSFVLQACLTIGVSQMLLGANVPSRGFTKGWFWRMFPRNENYLWPEGRSPRVGTPSGGIRENGAS